MAESTHEGLYDALLLEIAAARSPSEIAASRSGPIRLFLGGVGESVMGLLLGGAIVLMVVMVITMVISSVGESFGAWSAQAEMQVALVVLAAGALAAVWRALLRLRDPGDEAGYDTALQVISRLGSMADRASPVTLEVVDGLGRKGRGWRWVMSVPTSGGRRLVIKAEGDNKGKSLKASGWSHVDGLEASVRGSAQGWVDPSGRRAADPAVAVAAALVDRLRGVNAAPTEAAALTLGAALPGAAPPEPGGSFKIAASLEPDHVQLPTSRLNAKALLSNAIYWSSPVAVVASCVALAFRDASPSNAVVLLSMAVGVVFNAASPSPLSPLAMTRQPRRRGEASHFTYDAASGALSLGEARVDLGAPFAVNLTRQVTGGGLLGVEVVSGRDRLRCRVPVERSAFVDALPALELGDAPLIEAVAFAREVWPALRWRAALHGLTLIEAAIKAPPEAGLGVKVEVEREVESETTSPR